MKIYFVKYVFDEESLKIFFVWIDYLLFGELYIFVFIKFVLICSGYIVLRCYNLYFKNDIGLVES